MRKTVRKWFWLWNWEKEEAWLNEMAAKGLCLVNVGFCRFDFVETLPGEYQIRMEMLENMPSNPESQQYLGFLEEMGAEHVGSFNKVVYLRKKTAEGPFELFSDLSSKIKHLTRIITLLFLLGGVNAYNGIWNIYLFFINSITLNLVAGILCILFSLFLLNGARKLCKQRSRLKKEQTVFDE